jgi:hypothetical protein
MQILDNEGHRRENWKTIMIEKIFWTRKTLQGMEYGTDCM